VTKNVVTTNYEVGFKSLFFDNKLALSGTYFHTDVKNDPWFTFIPSIDAQILIGIDEVKINGGEFESQLNLGRFSANLGVGVTDAKIAKYSLDPSLVGDWAPYVPNVTTSVGFQYSLLLPDSLSLVPRVDYELRGHQYWDPENNTARRALNLVNARLTLAKTDAGLEAAAFVKNLTNLRYNEEWVAGGYAFPANPRTYGVSLRYKF
jgi:iron complex outermembrane receptor protein